MTDPHSKTTGPSLLRRHLFPASARALVLQCNLDGSGLRSHPSAFQLHFCLYGHLIKAEKNLEVRVQDVLMVFTLQLPPQAWTIRNFPRSVIVPAKRKRKTSVFPSASSSAGSAILRMMRKGEPTLHPHNRELPSRLRR